MFGRWWRRREWECWWSGHESISIFWIKSAVAVLGLLGGRNGYIYCLFREWDFWVLFSIKKKNDNLKF